MSMTESLMYLMLPPWIACGAAKLAKAKASGGRLFDQSKFRLHGIVWAGDETLGGDGLGDDAALMNVQIGLTSYKEYVCSNLLPTSIARKWRRMARPRTAIPWRISPMHWAAKPCS